MRLAGMGDSSKDRQEDGMPICAWTVPKPLAEPDTRTELQETTVTGATAHTQATAGSLSQPIFAKEKNQHH